MDFVFPLITGVLAGCAVGMLVTWIVMGRRAGNVRALRTHHASEITAVRAEESLERAHLGAELSAARATVESLREQLATHASQHKEFVEHSRAEVTARAAANDENTKLLEALAPIRSSLLEMTSKVSSLETQRATQHGELAEQLRQAAESEERLRSTAESLATALRANNVRGVWGETQLRSVVEAAGLLERVDFETQSSIEAESGAGRPDMIVSLPGGKSIAVDAKVPFNAYLEASQIPATATGTELAHRETLMKQHVKALRDHISALSAKGYWSGLDSSPELVIAFIPSESLVSSALQADPSIMDFAFSKRVALASPVTLWSVLKTVAFAWQQNVVTDEAKMLLDLSNQLYGRLITMAGHIDKLGRSIRATVIDYNKFVGSLERQVLPTARKLSVIDESKIVPALTPYDDVPRELTAVELCEANDDPVPHSSIAS